jgi:hypothetical protein
MATRRVSNCIGLAVVVLSMGAAAEGKDDRDRGGNRSHHYRRFLPTAG